MKKGCELCGKPARMYCDSDQAILCWDCDERVHCANFLVAKHSRSLLCHVCQSPTPWKATGTKLGPTVSVCEGCSKRHREDEEEMESVAEEDSDDSEEEDSVEISDEEFSDGDGDEYSEEEEEEEEEEEDGENQVVPWSPTANIPSSSSAPPATTSTGPCSQHGSLSGGSGEAAVSSAIKRFRHNPDTDDDEEEDGCCSSQDNNNKNTTAAAIEEDINGGTPFRALKMARTEEEEEEDINGGTPFRALKMARTEEEEEEEFSSCSSIVVETESRRRRMEIMRSLIRFQQRIVSVNPSEIITGISKLSRDF